VHIDVDKYPRTTYEYGNHVHICVYSYSIVDEIKQRNMVNSRSEGYSPSETHQSAEMGIWKKCVAIALRDWL
jgi:hypothetical protein